MIRIMSSLFHMKSNGSDAVFIAYQQDVISAYRSTFSRSGTFKNFLSPQYKLYELYH